MKLKARIVLCGAISRYNDATPAPGPANYANLVVTRSRMEGFIILDYAARFPEAIGALAAWLKEGKLKQKEDVAIGLENAPNTIVRLFTGQNFGKQLLKIADPPPRAMSTCTHSELGPFIPRQQTCKDSSGMSQKLPGAEVDV
jgi:NADPH-dependent curcumin reductase CurA